MLGDEMPWRRLPMSKCCCFRYEDFSNNKCYLLELVYEIYWVLLVSRAYSTFELLFTWKMCDCFTVISVFQNKIKDLEEKLEDEQRLRLVMHNRLHEVCS